jgi:hypothetical protein
MQSTLNTRPTDDPHDFVVVPPDVIRVVPSDDELSHVLRDAARHLGDTQPHAESGSPDHAAVPPVDTSFRATAVGNVLPRERASLGGWALRGLMAFLFAAFTGAAGIAWQFHGGPVKQAIAEWTPPQLLALASLQPTQEPAPSAQPAAPGVETAAAETSPAPSAPVAPPVPAATEAVVPAAAAPSPEQSQLIQSMARDLASAGQEIEQLKASIAELKAGQQQIAREIAKSSDKGSEQNQRPRASAPPPRPVAAHAPRKPPIPYPPRQATAAPAFPPPAPYAPPPPQSTAPPQASAYPADPGISSVPRPPMPVR